MWAFLVSFAAVGMGPAVSDSLSATPTDVVIGQQVIELRKPLLVRRLNPICSLGARADNTDARALRRRRICTAPNTGTPPQLISGVL